MRVMGLHPPLPGASAACIEEYNKLLCWICSPDQATFYSGGVLSVCDLFCDRLYAACGTQFGSGYSDGGGLCEAMGYSVRVWENSEPCFNAAARPPPPAAAALLLAALLFAAVPLLL
jgi:hypothetical protein